jgi:hypothetical protein
MRMTITLDDDVATELHAEVRQRRDATLNDVVNEMLRSGLLARREHSVSPFAVEARSMGIMPGLDYDNIGELVEQIEGANHK